MATSRFVGVRIPLDVYAGLEVAAGEQGKKISAVIVETLRGGVLAPRIRKTAGPGADLEAAVKRSEEVGAPIVPASTAKAAEREARRKPARPGAVGQPLDAVSTVTIQAGQIERGKATAKPDMVHVAPTRDNLPRPRPQFGKKKAEPVKTIVRQGYRELPGDEEAREAMLAKMSAVPLTVEEQCQPDEQGRYRKCPHGRNLFKCTATRCKVVSNR